MADVIQCNAVIKETRLSVGRYGLEFGLRVMTKDYDDLRFGPYPLYAPGKAEDVVRDYAGDFLWRVLTVTAVGYLRSLPNAVIRVRICRGDVIGIGHAIEDKWFVPKMEYRSGEQE